MNLEEIKNYTADVLNSLETEFNLAAITRDEKIVYLKSMARLFQELLDDFIASEGK